MERILKPIVLNAGEGKKIMVGTSRLVLKLFGKAVSNRLSIAEYELPPRFPGPPPHQHRVFEHAWYVLEGVLTIQLNQKTAHLEKGSFVFIPKMTVHAFANNSDGVVKLLVVDMPGGFENYYDDLQAGFGDGKAIDQEVMRQIQFKYDTYPPDYAF